MASEWKDVSFSQLCDITRGASPRPIHDWIADEGVPWVKISDASAAQSRFITRTGECIKREGRHRSVEVHPGDLILSNSATPGIPKFMGIDACIHDGWLLLRNLRNLDKAFAYYLLLHERPRLVEQGSGSVFTNLKTDILKNHRIQLPPLSEQRAIAHILGTLDDKIELNQRMNETLEAITRALFKSWFVDFDPVRAKVEGHDSSVPKPLADLFPARLVDSKLGKIPEGWEVRPLSDCVDVARGLSYKGVSLSEDGVPMHNLNSIYEGGGYKHDGLKRYDGDYKAQHVVRAGDLIVANTEQGHHRLLIGYAAIVPAGFGQESLFSHHIYRVRPERKSELTADYLCHLLNTSVMHDIVSGYANGTTVNMLPIDGLQSPLIVIPPARAISAFTGIAEAARLRHEGMVDESRTLAALRDALLPKLISGELRVEDEEDFVGSGA